LARRAIRSITFALMARALSHHGATRCAPPFRALVVPLLSLSLAHCRTMVRLGAPIRLIAPAGRHIYSQCHRPKDEPQRGGTYHSGCRPAGAQFGLSPCVSINISPRWGSQNWQSPYASERDSSGTTEAGRHDPRR
jgi:hypothetical protein